MKSVLLAAIFLCCLSVSWAAEDPSVLVRTTSEQVRMALMKENGANTEAVRAEVEKIVFPRFDFTRMTALAVGKHWRLASDQQKTALTTEFRILLTRTYFSTMLRYRDAKIVIKPDALIENEGKEATVKSQVQVSNANAPVAIDYVLYNTAEGWKFFNVSVEGASLVTVYRNQFGDEVTKGGIDGLILSLHTKNLATPSQSANASVTPAKG
jgi:phospholipid transport system substrate-binding protein